jgi:hypothetical protein
MKKYYFLIIVGLILGLALTGCSLLSNISQVPTTQQSGITYLTKGGPAPDPSLVGLWHFDKGEEDTAYDSSVYGNDGTLYNFESPYGWVLGNFGNALNFDGVNDYVDIPDLSITGDFSIEFWVNLDSGIGNQDAVVGQEGSGQDINFYAGRCRWFTARESGFPWDAIIATTPAVANTWEYYAITRNGDTLTLYRNGVADVIKYISNINALPFHPKAIGRGNAGYFSGTIDEVRIWNRALTDGEIAYNYDLRDVLIDIKPGSDINSINLGSHGVVPVAILGSIDFDAATVDPLTVTLSGAEVKVKGHSGNAGSLEDVNGDGYTDLLVQVYTENLDLTIGEINAVLNAYTYAGPALTGSDSIRIVPPE